MPDKFSAPEFSSDSIHIEQLEMFARVGVPEEERKSPQRITLTITLWPLAGLHDLGDDIGRTINYSAIAQTVRESVAARRDKLIETLAEQVALHLLGTFPIAKVRIELRKFVVPDAKFVSVALTRERTHE